MNVKPEDHWIRVLKKDLDAYLATQNYLRDMWGDCDYYVRVGSKERIAAYMTETKACYIIPKR